MGTFLIGFDNFSSIDLTPKAWSPRILMWCLTVDDVSR